MKKSKNQLILDKAMEDEFNKTLKLFDEFVEYLSVIDEKLLQMHKSVMNQPKTKEAFHLDNSTMKVTINVTPEDTNNTTEKATKREYRDIGQSDLANMREKLQLSINILKDDSFLYKK